MKAMSLPPRSWFKRDNVAQLSSVSNDEEGDTSARPTKGRFHPGAGFTQFTITVGGLAVVPRLLSLYPNIHHGLSSLYEMTVLHRKRVSGFDRGGIVAYPYLA